ncbi:Rv0361 family membrane protein [Nocardia bovistercoris]|nr:hypothetical protein [Nocardia bovistercoris]
MTSPVQSTNHPQGVPVGQGAPVGRGAPVGQRPIAAPQRIAPTPPPVDQAPSDGAAGGRSKKWLLAVLGAAAVLVAIIVAVAFALVGKSGSSPDAEVRAAISQYTDGLRTGNLAQLRSSTCGPLHDFYAKIPEDQFANVHRMSLERKSIPVVDAVNAISITGDTAIAEATVYTEADPAKRSARTFDLQRSDSGWKVCDPATTP